MNSNDYVKFKGKTYQIRTLGEGTIIGTESLEDALIDEDGYTSSKARNIDEFIAYYVPSDKINLSDGELIKYIRTYIDEEFAA